MKEPHWLISVLADLEEFSGQNELSDLRGKLNEAQKIAAEEIPRVLDEHAAIGRAPQ